MATLAVKKEDKYLKFDEKFSDGRFCAEPSGKRYHLREAAKLAKELGRPLTDEEYERFRIQ